VYRAIYERRDVRSQFVDEPVSDEVLGRLLQAAHHAPSVGLMQPWSFVLVQSRAVREKVQNAFRRANADAEEIYAGDRRSRYESLKLEGILRAPINLCVTCEPRSARGHGLGRQTMPETAQYSVVCAVQNLWLAARAEGVGVGWVSILDPKELRTILALPTEVVPIAYLCIGYTSHFEARPDLERAEWESRVPLASVVYFDRYGGRDDHRVAHLLAPPHSTPT
jgi:5,6-dimethylbenzimidazole synthase